MKFDFDLDNNLLSTLLSALKSTQSAGSMPNTAKTFNEISKITQVKWREFAMGGSLDGVKSLDNPSASYSNSIKMKRNSTFDYTVGTGSEYAQRINDGTPEFDMKTKYPYGAKGRVSKKGVAYLIIPFRWGTAGHGAHFQMMSQDTNDIVSKFKMMMKTGGTHTEPNFAGDEIVRNEYNSGKYDRLKGVDTSISNEVGMVRAETGKNTGAYFTFRIISADSPAGSWVRKAQPSRDAPRALINELSGDINSMLTDSMIADLGFGGS